MAETESTSPNQVTINMPKETLTISLFESSLDKIKNWIDNTNPDSVRRAGDYYLAAQALLENAARELKNKAVDLAGHYQGPASVETQKQLRFLHATIRDLASEMGKMGPPLHRYADTLVWAMQNIVVKRGEDSRSDHDTDWADMIPFYGAYRVEDRARDKFYEVNERIAEHYALLPSSVQSGFPTPTPLETPDFKPGGVPTGGVGGLPGGTVGSVPSYGSGDLPGSLRAGGGPYDLVSPALDTNGPGGEGADLFGPDPDAGSPGLVHPSGPSGLDGNGPDPSVEFPGGTGTSGQDLSVPDGGTRLSGLNDTGLTGPANPLTTGLSTNGLSANGGSGIGTPGIGTSGIGASGGAGSSGAGAGGAGLWGAGGVGAGSGTRSGMNGMPMMPYGGAGGGQGGEKENENTTELLEDDEVWGGGGATIPPLLT